MARLSRVAAQVFRRVGIRRCRCGVAIVAAMMALSSLAQAPAPIPEPLPAFAGEAPNLRATLELAFAAEIGRGQPRSPRRAALLYCDAAAQGSSEGAYRLGRMMLAGHGMRRDLPGAATLFALAEAGGHPRAAAMLDLTGRRQPAPPECLSQPEKSWSAIDDEAHVDIERYAEALPPERQKVAALIRRLAPAQGVDARLALAVAAVESNFNAAAVSPKNAQGVMQLIPDTAARFRVRNAFDAEQNIRGGLAYLAWLLQRFAGDVRLATAAYNAGEGAVDKYKGIPPYAETQAYVQRILQYLPPPARPESPEVNRTIRGGLP